MNTKSILIGGAAAGAALMYLLDPVFGGRRRALMRDKAVHLGKKTGLAVDTIARDMRHRSAGWVAQSRNLFRKDEVSDDILIERVRAAIGRVVSHPHSIEVTARDGRVTLSGPILANEQKPLIRRVLKTRGVRSVESDLEPHERAENIPGLQGGTRREERTELLQQNWSPAARCLTTAAGSGLIFFGLGHRGIPGIAAGVVGAALFARGATNLPMRRLLGIRSGRRAVDVQKTIRINAPVERVFDMWTKYENFPLFMSRVREVRDLGNGRSHWVVMGPAKTRIEWDAVVTQHVANRILAWKSEPGALAQNAGIIHFDQEGDKTRVQIRLSYNPPIGALGHSVAWLFGSDPKREMDADLSRMKTFIETGIRPHDAAGKLAV
ncbi:MAG: SRPBCC family protein [Acidobacteria bacterium]|nr:SRPBCC family protein [Acidobacteriota bacterium]